MTIYEFRKEKNYFKTFSMVSLSLFLLCLYGYNLVWAQEKEYPSKTIKIIVPFAVGGMNDPENRLMADYFTRELGVPVIVENRPGAGGTIGATEVFKAKPDGYTIMGSSDGVLTLSPHLTPNIAYDPSKDFLPIDSFGVVPITFGVHKSSSINTLADLAREAKKNPGKLTFALPQLGQLNHLIFEVWKKAASVDIKIVPYEGTGDAVAALLGKHVDVMGLSYSAFSPYVKSGEVRLIAATPKIPGSSIQTFAEAGCPQADLVRLCSHFVSAKTPKPIYEKLVLSFKRVVTNPEVVKKLENFGYVAQYRSPDEVTSYMKKVYPLYSTITNELGLKKKTKE
jgi:tripartite-type tricarboxylate transporter receptor subunit TctC